jgi:hypothetical protein
MPTRTYMGKCPPGVVCITPGYVLFTGFVLIGVSIAFFFLVNKPAPVAAPPPVYTQESPVAIQIAASQDDRFTRAPKPERHWVTQPELPTSAEIYGKIPRVPTRGLPETYQSMGVITMEDGAILPLYGRRTASRSDRFQYYTRTDSYNPVQLPLKHKRRDCQDDIGCEELFDGENITVTPTGQTGRATIYRFDGPTYVPGIL